ncbi:cupin domain-containing protein [Mucilaginibacter ginsenosidivorans]|uniref:Cupin domain-containing protein n=1 Tax=Mucilaginibacter ginsenosidivorans TaxID=398053 RepID=A0A5B8UZU5_9SPHI|nr:cupin domain-containing protein [Mucilaginibacter ginsenosidivorans]QEC64295.1 cupin domain-containing protein [Mucilaginibacter ginsenosidivorans]
MKNNTPTPIITGPYEGPSLSVVGDTYRILVSGKQTGSAFATIDMLVPPGGGPGPHAHPDFEETFYVVDGEVEVKSEAGTYIAQKGAYVVIPKGGMVHCFKNKSDKMAHLLCTVIPAGLEDLFIEIGRPVKYDEFLPAPHLDPEGIGKLVAIAEKHGQKVFPPDYLG